MTNITKKLYALFEEAWSLSPELACIDVNFSYREITVFFTGSDKVDLFCFTLMNYGDNNWHIDPKNISVKYVPGFKRLCIQLQDELIRCFEDSKESSVNVVLKRPFHHKLSLKLKKSE